LIDRTDAIEERSHEPAGGERGQNTCRQSQHHGAKSSPDDQTVDLGDPGSEREANAELVAANADAVSDYAIDAQTSQQQGGDRERHRGTHLETALRHGLRDNVTHGADLRRGNAGIEGLQSAAHAARNGQRVRRGSDYEMRYLIGMFPEGHVDHEARVAVQFGAVYVGDDAHDFGVAYARSGAHHSAQRILIRPELRSQARGNHGDVAVAVGPFDSASAQ
jgi:hypothetical protein